MNVTGAFQKILYMYVFTAYFIDRPVNLVNVADDRI